MNNDRLKHRLLPGGETHAEVSEELHNRIMRSVRLSATTTKSRPRPWSLPMWGAGMAATAVAVLYLAQTNPQQTPVLDIPVASQAVTSVNTLFANLKMETVLPEKALEKELERLKSDLKRFDFRS
jgi:hypothetical protein